MPKLKSQMKLTPLAKSCLVRYACLGMNGNDSSARRLLRMMIVSRSFTAAIRFYQICRFHFIDYNKYTHRFRIGVSDPMLPINLIGSTVEMCCSKVNFYVNWLKVRYFCVDCRRDERDFLPHVLKCVQRARSKDAKLSLLYDTSTPPSFNLFGQNFESQIEQMEGNANFFTSKDGNPLKLDFCRIYGFQRFDQLKKVIQKHLISRLYLDFNHYTFTEHVSADFFDDFPKYTQLTQLSVTYKISEDAYSFMGTLTKMIRYFPNLESICINLKCNLWRGIDFDKLKGKRLFAMIIQYFAQLQYLSSPILHIKPTLNLEIHMVFKIDCEDKSHCKTRWLYQLHRQLQPSSVEKIISGNAKTKAYHLQWHDEQPQVQIQLDVCLSRKTNRFEKISASMFNMDDRESGFIKWIRNMLKRQPKSTSRRVR